jgi:hypothetical protein
MVLVIPLVAFAQIGDEKEFAKQGWDKFDFSKKRVTRAQIAKLKYSTDDIEIVDELAIVRGILFGKRGRIFSERSLQDYLEKQKWYKPNPNFRNSMLSAMERVNIDIIRGAEADRHTYVEPGDLRFWRNKEIPDDKIFASTAADWQVIMAEIEAVHGKTFPEQEWLQKYFDQRYWYKRNPKYSPALLNEFERRNLAKISKSMEDSHNTSVSVGDMDKFQSVSLTRELLKDVTLNDLRLMRLEFYARRGMRFSTPGFLAVFEWRDWYRPLKDQKRVKLGKIEEQNVKLLEALESEARELLSRSEIDPDDLQGLFIEDLRVLRNEIYARHGRVFKDAELQKYFAAQPWYKPDPEFTDDKLSELELKNIATIKQAEEVSISKFVKVEG